MKIVPVPGSLRLVAAGAALFLFGWFVGARNPARSGPAAASGAPDAAVPWTCSMHPQIRQPKPGKCPICAMDLIPVTKAGNLSGGPRQLVMSAAARELARVASVPVERRFVPSPVRLTGKVAFDETRTKTLAARFPARIDRLYVDYTGVGVRRGDHLAHVYSPELLTAQRELVSALQFGSNVETLRDKLRLWGLPDARIREIEERKAPSDRMDIDAPLGGIVMEKHVKEGDYVQTGSALFTIGDLEHLWIRLDAYESDLPWIRFGQPVRFEAEAVPGRVFEGMVAFVAPMVDPVTRTIMVRVNAPNPDLALKPEMFVRAEIQATVAANGRVVAPALAGKWISPMHPEIIRDEPGPCPVCGMALVPASELGYAPADESSRPPLVIPASAVLRTGKRAVVYVELPGASQPTYEGREIVLGPRAGSHYLVVSGLDEGERVVTEGSFKIDSALQILAKPSLMSLDDDAPPSLSREDLARLLAPYLALGSALAGDDEPAARAAARELEAAAAPDSSDPRFRDTARAAAGAASVEDLRRAFDALSRLAVAAAELHGSPGPALAVAHCPMAFRNQGADWLQAPGDLRNPYFGARMLTCGEIRRTLPAHGNP
jgi:Cu(I)/Ag(I) efflux system membrane fusion protein